MAPRPPPDDDDPNAVILGPGRVREYGHIDDVGAAALAVRAGPILLLNGNIAWGWLHLVKRRDRVEAIKGLGFDTCQAFVYEVAQKWTKVQAADEGRLKLIYPKDGYELAIVVEWSGRFWSVTTALPYRASGKPILYEKTV